MIAVALVISAIGMLCLFGLRIEPSALLLRTYLDKFASATAIETDHYSPTTTVTRKLNQNYGNGGVETSFDVFRLKSAGATPQPTVFWIHGGGWIGGSKDFVAPYLRKMASSGITVIGVNYPLAPGHQYPTAVEAINSAIRYVLARATFYGVDRNNIVLAGNEAGANLASQIAGISTNASYSEQVGIASALSARQLKGVILDGGIYDVPALDTLTGLSRWRVDTELWAYTGSRGVVASQNDEQISTIQSISSQFPSTWMTGGDMDPLTQNQSVPFAAALTNAGVSVTSLFADSGSNLPADYQFMLALPSAKRAFGSMLDFIHQVTDVDLVNSSSD